VKSLSAARARAYAPKIREVFELNGKVNVCRLASMMEVSVRRVAPGLGITEGAVRHKATPERAQPAARRVVDVLQRAYDAFGDWKDTMIWLRAERSDLSGQSPLDLIVGGRSDVVDDLISNIDSGQPG
jgi:hypothetical protein